MSDRGPRSDRASEAGLLPDTKEGRYEGHDTSTAAQMRGLVAWFVIGLVSIAAYMTLALANQPIWDGLPFLALMAVSIFVCGTAGVRRGR